MLWTIFLVELNDAAEFFFDEGAGNPCRRGQRLVGVPGQAAVADGAREPAAAGCLVEAEQQIAKLGLVLRTKLGDIG